MSHYTIAAGILSILLALYFWISLPKGTFKSYFAKSQIFDRACVLLGLAALCLNFGITTVFGKLLPQFNPAQSGELREMMKDLTGKILVLVLTLIFAPLAEEILFRGLLVDGFQHLWKRRAVSALMLAALCFALCHGLTQIPGVFVFAFCLGLLRLRTGSLRQNIIVHACNNLIGLSILIYGWEISYILAGMLMVAGVILLRALRLSRA